MRTTRVDAEVAKRQLVTTKSVNRVETGLGSNSPRRTQLEPGFVERGVLSLKRLHRAAIVEIIPWNGSSEPEILVPSERTPRSAQARPVLPFTARLRPFREPGGSYSPYRRQPGQGDAGTEPIVASTSCHESWMVRILRFRLHFFNYSLNGFNGASPNPPDAITLGMIG